MSRLRRNQRKRFVTVLPCDLSEALNHQPRLEALDAALGIALHLQHPAAAAQRRALRLRLRLPHAAIAQLLQLLLDCTLPLRCIH